MGYACPVCETPQRDGEHLANHLAFTAMLGNDAHEEWLNEYAPGWGEAGADELAARVLDHAPEAEFEAVFEDTVDRSEHDYDHDHDHDHDHGSSPQHDHGPDQPPVNPDAARGRGAGSLDADAEDILREAQEMTQELLDDSAGTAGDADSEGTAGDDDSEGKES